MKKYILKRCIEGNKAHGGFVYPAVGETVKALDWEPTDECGNGLHGWTDGHDSYFDEKLVGNFIVVEVEADDGYVELGDKIKFKEGKILINTTTAEEAHAFMRKKYPDMLMHWSIAKQGDRSTAKQGDRSTAKQGDFSIANQGDSSTAKQGDFSIANQGDSSTAKQGDRSTAKQGDRSTANQGDSSTAKQGDFSIANQGNFSVSNQGDFSTANQGYSGTAKQGDRSIANQGYSGTAKQGDRSIANQGDRSTANQGDSSTAKQGDFSIANQGYSGTANQGDSSTAKQGDFSIANQGDSSTAKQGDRSTAKQGDRSTANQGDSSTAKQGDFSIANQGDSSTAKQGDFSVSNQGYSSTAKQGYKSVSIHKDISLKSSIIRFAENSVAILFGDGDVAPYVYTEFKNETVYFFDGKPKKIYTTTPENIENLEEHEIFVFGSNLAGKHVGGAAKTASKLFGADDGVGEGITGNAYAFPTLNGNLQKRIEADIKISAKKLIKCARENTDKIFLLTRVGCGIAGYSPKKMRELFKNAPANIIQPDWNL